MNIEKHWDDGKGDRKVKVARREGNIWQMAGLGARTREGRDEDGGCEQWQREKPRIAGLLGTQEPLIHLSTLALRMSLRITVMMFLIAK